MVAPLPPVPVVELDLQLDYLARGESMTADMRDFRDAAVAIMKRSDKAAILNIPKANYYIRGQRNITAAARLADPKKPHYVFESIFKVTMLKDLEILGNGATISLDWQQRFGAFELHGSVATSRRAQPPQYVAEVGPVLDLCDATGPMIVTDLNFVTLQDKLVLGNEYRDTGRQVGGSSIVLEACPGAHLSRITTEGMPLDGITICDQKVKRKLGEITIIDNVHS
ncbi:uncharacterized protein CcaverHIS019_0212130 [Cutaneotrichosporon cavernicola]|uniref:Uncharacterized protein n=1 Tax=Cutaneotrichosporon cavernicola TaxID=279322 RepID=A0AA48IEM6_9TREE|nr:uncharacterized protein CcaverHIS019_0212130 [Cutaneotrichosporon cavernicola]BEI89851.1 hypothetical protein CcaverHIS019_0212130 [Cutaneotrichosporon cavernicola]BEJ05400.1 hypothetical protein CcaverHIS641_0212170 [Cutaneotrichosporon cavernicola]